MSRFVWAIAGVALALACGGDAGPAPPVITGQGFSLSELQRGELGEAVSFRVRVESEAGVEHLFVRERSYEADLARTPEADHLPLFGLDRRTWSKTDVTLDFGPYVAEKIAQPGEYAIEIEVRDRSERTSSAVLRLVIEQTAAAEVPASPDTPAEPPAESEAAPGAAGPASRPVRDGAFRLVRMGEGLVVSEGGHFDLSWITVEPIRVTIRMRGEGPAVRGLALLGPDAFDGIETRQQLDRAIASHRPEPVLEIATANGAAAGTVFAIVHPTDSIVLLAESSTTSLSPLGTTVALTGRFKR